MSGDTSTNSPASAWLCRITKVAFAKRIAQQQQHERLATRLAELRQEAGVASDDDFERLAVAAARRKALARTRWLISAAR